ncbi:hypothetical protein C6I20_04645 [Aeromicrobium sp. A1-2]|uniref:hypothetical protein n=1 Tax=Aeromicrobium sp. A1-2 TaxID=2107713 RepID=UPI000E4B62BC|nr:hypothetical protein [Aeromicrobium sp. A1-2]AXT84556.1 hypothetical protein C6I20_04645 [Aeromicrobium sp. A1-2]
MRSQVRASLIAVVVATITACGSGAPQADGPTPPAGPTLSQGPDPNAKAIREFDFSTAKWFDTPRDESVTLDGSKPVGTIDRGQYSLGDKPIVYGDVDADGFEDAMANLTRIEGNGLSQIWYVWLWDADKETAVQVLDPIAETARCATVVTKVTPVEGAFRVSEKRLDLADIGACSETPPHDVTRTVSIVDGRPVQAEGYGGYGGNCPQPGVGDADAYLLEDTRLFTGPDDSTTEVTGEDIYSYYGLPLGASSRLNSDDWVLVGFGPNEDSATFDEYGPYIPCAWAQKTG